MSKLLYVILYISTYDALKGKNACKYGVNVLSMVHSAWKKFKNQKVFINFKHYDA